MSWLLLMQLGLASFREDSQTAELSGILPRGVKMNLRQDLSQMANPGEPCLGWSLDTFSPQAYLYAPRRDDENAER